MICLQLSALALLVLSGCNSDDTPTAAHIEEGYVNLVASNTERAVAHYGSLEAIPPVTLGFIQMTARVENPRCEKNQNDLGYICLYNLTMVNRLGVALDPLPDIKARVWQADVGWMVHEDEG